MPAPKPLAHALGMTLASAIALAAATPAHAGAVFVTGHDADFHASLGPNPVGAQNIINRGLDFVRSGNTAPILFIKSNTDNVALGDHTDSEAGLIASGYTAGATPGNHYVTVNATDFASVVLSDYSAIFVPSDHGGILTEADLAALNARTADIIAYINAGGGLMALPEDGFHSGKDGLPDEPLFGFLPFLVTAAPVSEAENGNTLTPFGASLGLTNADINGNFSHNIFTSTGGMTVVDVDAGGEILTLAFEGQLTPGGVVAEPATLGVLGLALAGLAALRRRAA